MVFSDLLHLVEVTEDTTDIEYVTVYVGKSKALAITDLVYIVENADFDGWFVEDKKVTTETVGQTGFEVVKAAVDKEIYTVEIITDEGIKSVAIDGINLVNMGGNVYVTYYELVAGAHTVSFEYRDGYTGTVTMFVDKTAQSGYTFQLSGTEPEDRDVTITLTGTVIADKDITIDVGGEGEGMSLTEILLIVLVVLILIMAIIVAMRLMRS